MGDERIILVTGSTGRQGGAVARHLIKAKHDVRALTRDPNKPAARELGQMGCDIVQGDLDDADSVRRALEGCYGLFSVQSFWDVGKEGEIRQGKLLADLAKAEGVQHLVYSSVGGANRETNIPHFDSKWEIEQHIRELGLPATVFRPSFFYENFESPDMRDAILGGKLQLPMMRDRSLQMIATDDIGGFVTLAFNKPQQFIGKSIDISGDELTMPQVAATLSSVLNRLVTFEQIPMEQVERQSSESAIMFRWFNEVGYNANIGMLRDIYPPLATFETWLRRRSLDLTRKVA